MMRVGPSMALLRIGRSNSNDEIGSAITNSSANWCVGLRGSQIQDFLWRPLLPDPKDDMVLEAAVNGGCNFVVTHNVSDFAGSQNLGVAAVTPAEFIGQLLGKST